MQIHSFFDARTFTLTYVVWDPSTGDAVVIDPVLDFDPVTGKIWGESVSQVQDFIKERGLRLRWVLETHAHADHLSGSQRLKESSGAGVAIGTGITEVQRVFAQVFDLGPDFPTDGRQFDHLLQDGELLQAGSLQVQAIHTPGHTPACMSYLIGDAVFTGDALFMPDYGVGRCDFPAGSAKQLYHSVHERLYALPPQTRVFVGHDYQPGGRTLKYETSIGESAAKNVQLRTQTSESDFVAFRQARDATLAAPRLLLPSVQVNIDAGKLPRSASGRSWLRVPLRVVS